MTGSRELFLGIKGHAMEEPQRAHATPSIAEILSAELAKLTSSQKKLADLFHHHPDILAFEPAVRIGGRVGVSEATVHRLAAKLGFDSFSGLQRYAQRQFMQNRTVERLKRHAEDGLSMNEFIQDSFAKDALNLESTMHLNGSEVIHAGAAAIAQARRVYVAGWRAGLYVTAGLSYSLDLMLGNTVLLPMHSGLHEAMRFMEPGDVLIATALPRYCDVTLEVVTHARNRGLATITITDAMSSPFVPLSSVAFYVSTYSNGFMDSYLAAVAIANALVAAVGRIRQADVEQNLKRLEHLLFPYEEERTR